MRAKKVFAQFLGFTALISCSLVRMPSIPVYAADKPLVPAEVGKAAPDFSLKDAYGKSVSLKDFQNKIVVLEWFDDLCPFVKKHYKSGNMQSLQTEFGKKGIVWLVINSSGPGMPGFHNEVESQLVMKGWKFASPYFLLDPDGKVGHRYGAKTTPDMYVIGKDGTLLYSGAIDDQPDTDVASIKSSRNYVREALALVIDGKAVKTSTTKPYG